MARTSFARLSLLTVAVLLLGACSSTPGSSSSAAADDRCAGVGTSGGEGELQIPDVEEGKFNVAMVLIGPHDDAGWSQAHYEGLRYVCENIEDSHVAYVENVLEGPPPSRYSGACRARASTSSSAPRSATWTRWPRLPRSSRTSRTCT